jgi:hypothetical protein
MQVFFKSCDFLRKCFSRFVHQASLRFGIGGTLMTCLFQVSRFPATKFKTFLKALCIFRVACSLYRNDCSSKYLNR